MYTQDNPYFWGYFFFVVESADQDKGFAMGKSLWSLKRCDDHLIKKGKHAKRKKNEKGKEKAEREISKVKRKREEVNNGDRLNLSDLLFTKERDYLIKSNDDQQLVKAEQLEGKFIVLLFVSLLGQDNILRQDEVCLTNVYNELKPKGHFEVVLIAVGDAINSPDIDISHNHTLLKRFQKKFSRMPWTAIPFSDSISRNHLGIRFGISIYEHTPSAFVIDPTGMVLQRRGFDYFRFGAEAFPFTEERIECLLSEDDAFISNPSRKTLEKLLVSPERDYVINNKNVPVRDLNNKVVALYLYEDGCTNDLTAKLKKTYEELVFTRKKNFEVVLVYIHDSWETYRTTEETFWKAFKTMPWLALPYKDPNCVKLLHMFNYPMELGGPEPDPSLVIIGRRGKFIELYGSDILMNFDSLAYPFTRDKATDLVVKEAKKLKLEMFWGPDAVFKQKNGSSEKVQFSRLVGKKIIVLSEQDWLDRYAVPMRRLEEMYIQMKGTDDEFEVIHVFYSKRGSSYYDRVTALPWLTHSFYKKDSDARKLFYSVFLGGNGLLAFDHDGTIARRAYYPTFEEDKGFPFYDGDMLKEAMIDLNSIYNWEYPSDDDDDSSCSEI